MKRELKGYWEGPQCLSLPGIARLIPMKRELKEILMQEYLSIYRIARLIPMKRELKERSLRTGHRPRSYRKAHPDEKGTERHDVRGKHWPACQIARLIPMKRELKGLCSRRWWCSNSINRKAHPDEKGTERPSPFGEGYQLTFISQGSSR